PFPSFLISFPWIQIPVHNQLKPVPIRKPQTHQEDRKTRKLERFVLTPLINPSYFPHPDVSQTLQYIPITTTELPPMAVIDVLHFVFLDAVPQSLESAMFSFYRF